MILGNKSDLSEMRTVTEETGRRVCTRVGGGGWACMYTCGGWWVGLCDLKRNLFFCTCSLPTNGMPPLWKSVQRQEIMLKW